MALLLAGLWRPLPRHGANEPAARTDSALFGAVVSRVEAGTPYYQAMGTELRTRGYPSASIFNWRQPTLFVGLAIAPVFMRVMLIGLVAWALVGTAFLFSKARTEILLFAVTAEVGAAATALTPLGILLPETWAGVCLAVSALAYARGQWRLGAGIALAGLFLRELLMPYVAVCLVLAVRRRRWREVAGWALGLSAWSVFFAMHAMDAMSAMQPGDVAHPSWLQFGGFRFVLATVGFGGWLYLMPPWVAAIAVVLLAACAWAPTKAAHVKGAVVAYIAFFAVVGQPFNQGWGLLAAPAWAIGFGLGAQGLATLLRQAR